MQWPAPDSRICSLAVLQVVVDEAHHTVASTYKTILQGLGLIEEVLAEPAQDSDAQDQASAQPSTGAWCGSSSGDSMSGSLDSFDEEEGYGSTVGSRGSSRSAEGVLQAPAWKQGPLVRQPRPLCAHWQ